MKGRIKQIRKELDLTQQEFADRIGIARGNVGAYEVGKNAPSDAVISLICREFNVNEHWLRTGQGEMFVKQSRNEQMAKLTRMLLNVEEDSFKNRLISVLANLKEEQWQVLADIAEQLVNEKS